MSVNTPMNDLQINLFISSFINEAQICLYVKNHG